MNSEAYEGASAGLKQFIKRTQDSWYDAEGLPEDGRSYDSACPWMPAGFIVEQRTTVVQLSSIPNAAVV